MALILMDKLLWIRPRGSVKVPKSTKGITYFPIEDWENLYTYYDKVVLNTSLYKKIFGKEFKLEGYKPWKRGIVKISHSGNSVLRMYYGANRLTSKEAAVSIYTIRELGYDAASNKPIVIEATRPYERLLFYWQHPNHEIRVPLKVAVILSSVSIVLGVVSLFISLFD